MKKFNSFLSSILILVIVGILTIVVLVNLKVIDDPLYLFGGNEIKEINLTTKSLEMRKGEITQLETDNVNGESLVYSSSDPNVVTVNEVTGYVVAQNVGTATITVTLKDHKDIKDECTISVIKTDSRIKPSKISLSNKNITLTVGGKKTLYYTVSPKNSKVDKITWSTSDSSVATIDKYGTVKAVSAGTAIIKIRTDNELYDACTVTVKNKGNGGGSSSGTPGGSTTPQTPTYKLTYNANGGSVSPTSKTLKKGSSYGTLPTPTRSGYTFNGWYTAASGGRKVSSSTILNGNTVIYAQWTKNSGGTPTTQKYTLTYNANGGSVSPTNKTLTKGSSYGNLPTPTRSGYTFNGWYTAASGGSKVSSSTTINANTTIYAHWTKNSTPPPTTSGTSRIHFMNTGASDAIIIESNGHYGLIDSSNPYNDGTAYSVSNANESVQHVVNYLNKLGVKYFDFIVGTHSHSDHIGGMPVIASKFVNSKTTYYYRAYNGTAEDSSTDWDNRGYYNRAISAMKNAGANLQEVTGKSPTITLGDFTIKLMNTGKARSSEMSGGVVVGENKNAIVQYITYKGKHKTLLAADMEKEDEMDVANAIGSITVLKVGHHSSSTSSTSSFISKLSPKIAVITNNNAASTFTSAYNKIKSGGGTVYATGKADDAVIVTYNDNSCSASPSKAAISLASSGEWVYVDGKGWMLKKNGKYVYNEWYQDGEGIWYYMNSNGVCVTGWQELTWNGAKHWYYFKSDCAMVSDTCMDIKGEKFCFRKSGECYDGRGC